MSTNKVRIEVTDGLAVVTLADPPTLNAMGMDMAAELTSAMAEVSKTARAAVLTGDGRAFCSGANLSNRDVSGRVDAGAGLRAVYNPLVTTLRDLPIPFVTAVNGAAAGVGCSIALLGDLILAGESAYFLQAFRRIGLIPDGGSTYLLPRMIGRARAMEMMMLGEKIPAAKAEQWGLINRVVPDKDLMASAIALARELAEGPRSLALIRKAAWTSLDQQWDIAITLEANLQTIAGYSEDFAEGVSAFQQKRPAKFKGK